MSPILRSAAPLPDPEDRKSYLEEALSTARTLAGSLEYLARMHSGEARGCAADFPLGALFAGLKQQANWVVHFLEECA